MRAARRDASRGADGVVSRRYSSNFHTLAQRETLRETRRHAERMVKKVAVAQHAWAGTQSNDEKRYLSFDTGVRIDSYAGSLAKVKCGSSRQTFRQTPGV